MTTPTQALLRRAREVLEGTVHVPEGLAVRSAAFLARQAIEGMVTTSCQALGVSIGRAHMRSKIIVISALSGDEMGARADLAWAALCQACHHHAYELTPTADAIARWIGQIEAILLEVAGFPVADYGS
ncbi:hypothetical protein [Amycolatopsis sp. NPDC059021]|uniref:hypothetical protein n=1 Tax=Amycolatopsis sp. NPDC059021 TaxID=3346704 RepID=UPI00366B823F